MKEIVVEEEYHGVPIRVSWVDRGNPISANWCGYVQTDFTDADRDDLNDVLGVHGGLTYGPDEDGWIGFDCAHGRDLCVSEHYPLPPTIDEENYTVWTLEDVLAETRRLAEQIAVIEPTAETREVAELYAEAFSGNEQTEEWIREQLRDLGLDFEVEVEEAGDSRTSAGENS